MTRTAPKAARRKRATKKAIAVQRGSDGLNISLPPLNWAKVIQLVLWLGAAAMTYGTMRSDVGHLKADVTDMKLKIDAIYQHLAFRESGAIGPATIETSRSVSTTITDKEE